MNDQVDNLQAFNVALVARVDDLAEKLIAVAGAADNRFIKLGEVVEKNASAANQAFIKEEENRRRGHVELVGLIRNAFSRIEALEKRTPAGRADAAKKELMAAYETSNWAAVAHFADLLKELSDE